MQRRQMSWIAIAMTISACASSEVDEGVHEHEIRRPTFALPGELTAMVTVAGALDQRCTGFAIGPDSILTAAHCVCDASWIGGNICAPEVSVRFVSDATSTRPRRGMRGMAVAHPDYNPAWTGQQIEHDLAVIRLSGVAPAFVEPFEVATEFPAVHTPVIVAGFGRAGGDCDVAGDAAAYDPTEVSYYEDGHDIVGFYDDVACPGDSGGPVLDVAMRRAFAVSSMKAWDPFDGWDLLATTTGSHAGWIHDRVCASTRLNLCGIANDRCSCSITTSVVSMDPDRRVRATAIDGGAILSEVTWRALPRDWTLTGAGDLDGDRREDLVWRAADGGIVAWLVRDKSVEERVLGKPDPSAHVRAIADFDGDDVADLVYEAGGAMAIWYAGDPARAQAIGKSGDFAGAGDFDGDGISELLWLSPSGVVSIAGTVRGALDPKIWTFAAIGDLDANTRADIVWRAADGRVRIWFDGDPRDPEDPDEPSADNAGAPIDPAWQLAGVADLDHDGRDDLAWRTAGGLVVWSMAGARVVAIAKPPLGDGAQILGLASHPR